MAQCFASGCKHTYYRESCKFYRFPKNEEQKRKWIDLLRITDRFPTTNARICSCHFVGQNKSGKRILIAEEETCKNGRSIFKHDSAHEVPGPAKLVKLVQTPVAAEVHEEISNVGGSLFKHGSTHEVPGTGKVVKLVQTSVAAEVQEDSNVGGSLLKCDSTHEVPGPAKVVKLVQTPAAAEMHEDSNVHTVPGPSATHAMAVAVSNERDMSKVWLSVENLILKSEVDRLEKKLLQQERDTQYNRLKYTFSLLKSNVICMETGLPSLEMFNVVTDYVKRFKDSIVYFAGWQVNCLRIEDQVLLTLMKLRQNYTNLHLATLFHCSSSTISNVIYTFLYLLHELLFKDILKIVPSRHKNKTSLPESFKKFSNCRMIIDCTDVKIEAPQLLSTQKQTYSAYRGMHSFKVLIGVAPNGSITYVSKLFPGSASDKSVVRQSGVLDIFVPGDLIIADKGFLIQDILPYGVTLNIPSFLNNGQFNQSEIAMNKDIARCRIHVERANARVKEFRILDCIPCTLRPHAEEVVQVCAGIVNLQAPLIKEIEKSIM